MSLLEDAVCFLTAGFIGWGIAIQKRIAKLERLQEDTIKRKVK